MFLFFLSDRGKCHIQHIVSLLHILGEYKEKVILFFSEENVETALVIVLHMSTWSYGPSHFCSSMLNEFLLTYSFPFRLTETLKYFFSLLLRWSRCSFFIYLMPKLSTRRVNSIGKVICFQSQYAILLWLCLLSLHAFQVGHGLASWLGEGNTSQDNADMHPTLWCGFLIEFAFLSHLGRDVGQSDLCRLSAF